jgi:prepilin signal peptidase PulO-like enzyme (type II secretory pathway)
MDVYAAVTAVLISFVLLAVTGGMLMAFKKIKLKTAVPYIPFLLVAYIITLIFT